jgi:hypothetical protein
MYTITLADGTVLSDLTLNGNNYVSKTPIEKSVLSSKNLKHISINDGKVTKEYDNQVLEQLTTYEEDDGKEYHFILRDKTGDEIFREDVDAKLDYLAMMTEVDL